MAKGPHSSDAIEEYLIRTAKLEIDESTWEKVSETDRYNGSIDWPDFNEVDVEQASKEENRSGYINKNFESLDLVYDALKASKDNPDRIEGLRFLGNKEGERPESNPTWWRWRNKYEEAGLTNQEDDLTELGNRVLESSESTDINLPEIYRELRTTSNSSPGQNNGQKIKAFMLYGSGIDSKSVNKRVSLDNEHLRQMKQNLVYDHDLMHKDGSLTRDGQEMYSLIVDQLKLIENLT